jgi:hypothetical protein
VLSRFVRFVHALHRVKALFVSLATGAAVSGLNGIEVHGVPVDRIGMLADVGVGVIFVLACLVKSKGHAHDHSRAAARGEEGSERRAPKRSSSTATSCRT